MCHLLAGYTDLQLFYSLLHIVSWKYLLRGKREEDQHQYGVREDKKKGNGFSQVDFAIKHDVGLVTWIKVQQEWKEGLDDK